MYVSWGFTVFTKDCDLEIYLYHTDTHTLTTKPIWTPYPSTVLELSLSHVGSTLQFKSTPK
jgi:hypothetical protein